MIVRVHVHDWRRNRPPTKPPACSGGFAGTEPQRLRQECGVTHSRLSSTSRLFVAVSVSVLLLSIAAPADAHVSVSPTSAVSGEVARLEFLVPNERASATARVQVVFPPEHPVSEVTPVPGEWTVNVDRAPGDLVTSVTWSGGRIAGDSSETFAINLRLPTGVEQLALPVLQTYEDGEVVRWIEDPSSGFPTTLPLEEFEHPAPVLALTGSSPTSSTPSTAVPTPASEFEVSPDTIVPGESGGAENDNNGPLIALALVVGVAGLGALLVQHRRRKRD